MSQLPKNLVFRYENAAFFEKSTLESSSKAPKSIPVDLSMCMDVGPIQVKLKYATAISFSFFAAFVLLLIPIIFLSRKIRSYKRAIRNDRVPIYHRQTFEEEADGRNLTSFTNPYLKLTAPSNPLISSDQSSGQSSDQSSGQSSGQSSSQSSGQSSDYSGNVTPNILNNNDLVKCIASMWPQSSNQITTLTKLKEAQTARIHRLKEYHALEIHLFHRKLNGNP